MTTKEKVAIAIMVLLCAITLVVALLDFQKQPAPPADYEEFDK